MKPKKLLLQKPENRIEEVGVVFGLKRPRWRDIDRTESVATGFAFAGFSFCGHKTAHGFGCGFAANAKPTGFIKTEAGSERDTTLKKGGEIKKKKIR